MQAIEPKSDMRREIVSAATRLFAAQGYDGTALQEIADAVGIKKPSLLYHFASKEALRQAVLDDVLARWNDTLPKVLLAATAGEGQFDAVTAEIVSFFSEDPDRGRLLIREALDRPDDMRERLKKHVKPVVVNLSRYLESGQGRGDLWPELDPEAYLFQAIVLFVCGVTLSESFSPLMPASSESGAPQKRLERELLRMAKAAMFTGQARSSVVSGDEVSRGLFGEATKD